VIEAEMAKSDRKKPRYQVEAEARAAEEMARAEELSRTLGTRMPDGRVAADPSLQVPNNSYSSPPLFYEDRDFPCRDCGRLEVWTAEQQKWWYEVAKGPLYSGASRCRKCRVALREAHGGTPRISQRDRTRADEE
jgi:Probable zinc-ribbon domain